MSLKLREIERSDLAAINRWRGDEEVVRFLGANFIFVGPEIDQRWYETYIGGRDKAVRLAIDDCESKRLIGCVYLLDIHRINRTAEFAIMIGEKEFWGRGYGAAAAQRALSHAFDDLNLHRVYLSVLAENTRAIRLYERLGFRTEGRQRDAVFKEGRYRDVVLMAILEDEYRTSIAQAPGQNDQGHSDDQ